MRIRPMLMLLSALAMSACQPGDGTAGGEKDAAARAAFERMELQWRAEREQRLLAPDGWASLVGLHWIDPGPHFVGSSANSGIRLSMGPPELGLLRRDGDTVSFEPAAEGVTVDGKPVAGQVVLLDDAAPDGPSVIGFDGGDGQAMVIRRHGRLGLRVKHARAPTRIGFAGLDYWPVDPGWVVDARFVPNPPGTTIEIADITGGIEPVPNPGALEFTRDGKTHRIEALDEGGDE